MTVLSVFLHVKKRTKKSSMLLLSHYSSSLVSNWPTFIADLDVHLKPQTSRNAMVKSSEVVSGLLSYVEQGRLVP